MPVDPGMLDKLLNAFKEYPGILALLFIIYWLFKVVRDKDGVIKDLLVISQGDIERTSKLTTLLEILVSRKEGSGV